MYLAFCSLHGFSPSPRLFLQEQERLGAESLRVQELRRRCEEKEKLIPSQPESQREQLTLQLQQVSPLRSVQGGHGGSK